MIHVDYRDCVCATNRHLPLSPANTFCDMGKGWG